MKKSKFLALLLMLVILLCSCKSQSESDGKNTYIGDSKDYSTTASSSKAEESQTETQIYETTAEITSSIISSTSTTTSPTTNSPTQTTTVSTTVTTVASNKEKVQFYAKVDGDTAKFKFSNGDVVTCRFLAVNTPETVKPNSPVENGGPEASSFTENALKNASVIELEYDSNSDLYDKYGRLLAWVWIDGELLQSQLISQGYAEVKYIYGDYKYVDTLRQLEKVAKENKLGIWS